VDDSASRIVKRYARRVGLDVAVYSSHSLRSGFLTSAAESGASVFKIYPDSAGTRTNRLPNREIGILLTE
jgi:hypothetical protein